MKIFIIFFAFMLKAYLKKDVFDLQTARVLGTLKVYFKNFKHMLIGLITQSINV